MNVAERSVPERTVWLDDAGDVWVIDQRLLPFRVETVRIATAEEMTTAIAAMTVRGAGCIGACAGYGMYLAARQVAGLPEAHAAEELARLADALEAARPTAVNLSWAVQRQWRSLRGVDDPADRVRVAREVAETIADEDVAACASIGEHGCRILAEIHARTGEPVQVMTHCNAGWLAFVEHGSATAPIYAAHDAGIPVHVYVSETRPRLQGARLTAWELHRHGVPCTVIADNSAGHLLQHGKVDLVIVGSDRTTRCGDVANKIGTYLKAVAARDNGVPFYAALPSSTIDPALCDGVAKIPIEERGSTEVTAASGVPIGDTPPEGGHGLAETEVRIAAPGVEAANYGFDVTPARLVTGIITERGVCAADEQAILAMFPELARGADA